MKWGFSVVPPLSKIKVFVKSVRWQDGTHDLTCLHLYHSWITWMLSKITHWSSITQCWCNDGSSSRFKIKWIVISAGSLFNKGYWLRLCYKVSGRTCKDNKFPNKRCQLAGLPRANTTSVKIRMAAGCTILYRLDQRCLLCFCFWFLCCS